MTVDTPNDSRINIDDLVSSEIDQTLPTSNASLEADSNDIKTIELGQLGLRRAAGYIDEDYLPELRGKRGAETYKKMLNDPVIGAIVNAVDMLIRQVDWNVESFSDSPEDEKNAEFLKSCYDDLDLPFREYVSDAMGMIGYGWAYQEIVYKVRGGPDAIDKRFRSKESDGLIGWQKFAPRGQDTLFRWEYESAYNDNLLGMSQMPPPSYREIFIPLEKALLFRPRSHKDSPEGRALCLSTPIKTPTGWTTMAKIKVGDALFDENGKICYVSNKSDIWFDRPCYELEFGDSSKIIADENHLWATNTISERNRNIPLRIRTTKEIFKTQKNTNGVTNHSTPWAGPLDYPEQDLLIDPYTLGLWLGDGHSRVARITCHANDMNEQIKILKSKGNKILTIAKAGKKSGKGRTFSLGDDLTTRLRVLKLLQNKHIPDAYLRGSIVQRLALLQGLMDSDGTVDQWGRCEFTNSNKNLIDGVDELVKSLGCNCSIKKNKKYFYPGDRINAKLQSYDVAFTPSGLFTPFKLKRKIAKIKDIRSRKNHYIRSIKKIENRDTVCIEVTSKSHLFLAGKSLIPTHNSIFRSAYEPWYYKRNIQKIEAIGIERDLAGLPVIYAPPEYFEKDCSDAERQAKVNLLTTLRNLRRDEQEGVILPSIYDSRNNKLLSLELLSSAGSRQFDTNAVINRYDQRIAMVALADFILLGHNQVGSYSLAENKTSLFTLALKAWLDIICDIHNRHAIPRLWRINGKDCKRMPRLKYGDIEDVNLKDLAALITALSGAGMPLFPDNNLESHIRNMANLPTKAEVAELDRYSDDESQEDSGDE